MKQLELEDSMMPADHCADCGIEIDHELFSGDVDEWGIPVGGYVIWYDGSTLCTDCARVWDEAGPLRAKA